MQNMKEKYKFELWKFRRWSDWIQERIGNFKKKIILEMKAKLEGI